MSSLFNKKHFHFSFFFNFKYCLPTCQSPSFPSDQLDNANPSSSIFSTTSLIRQNFNFVYDDLPSDSTSKSLTFTTSSSEDSHDSEYPLDFTSVFASGRFFFSSPGSSKSIIESSDSKSDSETSLVIKNGVRVPKFSLNPYIDFRFSMQEMIEARGVLMVDVKRDLDYLHDLLFCYLSMNPKDTHKFIISAFTDLVFSLFPWSESESESGSGSESESMIVHLRKMKTRRKSNTLKRLV